jgi:DNA replication protein DnaC
MDHLRQSLSAESELGYDSLFEQVKSAPVLVLDGLSSRPVTPWSEEKLIQILNHRASGKMPTVVTTTEDIESLDPFISSRFSDTALSTVANTGIFSKSTDGLASLEKIPVGLKQMKFDTFDVRGKPGSDTNTLSSLKNAFKTATAYSDNPEGWLTLYSPRSGCGKTHLAVAIANEYEAKGQKVFFAFVPELMDHLRSAFSPDSPINSDAIFNNVKNSPLLILDDLGVERDSAWSQERLYQIIVYRQNYKLPTVITTRTDFPKEAKQGSAIASRIQDSSSGQVLKINAPDFRLTT